jgi:hypothetical protein
MTLLAGGWFIFVFVTTAFVATYCTPAVVIQVLDSVFVSCDVRVDGTTGYCRRFGEFFALLGWLFILTQVAGVFMYTVAWKFLNHTEEEEK